MNIKRIHIQTLLDRQFHWLTKRIWANLKAEGLGMVVVEMETTKPSLFYRLRPGTVITCQGVRLMVRDVYMQQRENHFVSLPGVYRVRVEFDRLDEIERRERARALMGPRPFDWLPH